MDCDRRRYLLAAMGIGALIIPVAGLPASQDDVPSVPGKATENLRVPQVTGSYTMHPGESLTVFWQKKRCIHARFCMTGAPQVFTTEESADWLKVDAENIDDLIHIIRDCPSGALTYLRTDGGPQESSPHVNIIRVRENGPLTFRADAEIVGLGKVYRTTLCRCGKTKNAPFCDSSHLEGHFIATGEIEFSKQMEELASRSGRVRIEAVENGPYVVHGPMEICSESGAVIAITRDVTLCRCGHSANKPFCDGSHAAVDFRMPSIGSVF